jgi:extracellular elastinolytic metalloproteinase
MILVMVRGCFLPTRRMSGQAPGDGMMMVLPSTPIPGETTEEHRVCPTPIPSCNSTSNTESENWDGTPDWENNHRAEGGEKQVFNFPYDPKAHITNTTEARGYIDAAISQVFYTSNIYHDFLEVLGFTEAAGNFEELNSGSLGQGGDAVQLNAQDGSGMNNANFMTPPDGQRPRMRMYLWNSTEIITDGDFDNGIILHEYTHGLRYAT